MADAAQFVVEGEYEDHEWRAAAAKPVRSEAEQRRFEAGPREHPFGQHAVRHKREDGAVLIFPNRDAKDAFLGEQESDAKPKRPKRKDTPAEPRSEPVAADTAGPAASEDIGLSGTQRGSDGEATPIVG